MIETFRLDSRARLGLFLAVLLGGTIVHGQEVDLRNVNRDYWSVLGFQEKVAYVNGAIGAAYALALVYMGENAGLGGPSLFEYAPVYVTNWRLVALIDKVYEQLEFGDIPVAAIIINYRDWVVYLGR